MSSPQPEKGIHALTRTSNDPSTAHAAVTPDNKRLQSRLSATTTAMAHVNGNKNKRNNRALIDSSCLCLRIQFPQVRPSLGEPTRLFDNPWAMKGAQHPIYSESCFIFLKENNQRHPIRVVQRRFLP